MIIRSASMAGSDFPFIYEVAEHNGMPGALPNGSDRTSVDVPHVLEVADRVANLPRVYVDIESGGFNVYKEEGAVELLKEWLSVFRQRYKGEVGFYGITARRVGCAKSINIRGEITQGIRELIEQDNAYDLKVSEFLKLCDVICPSVYGNPPQAGEAPEDWRTVMRIVYDLQYHSARHLYFGKPVEWFISIHRPDLAGQLADLRPYGLPVNIWGSPSRPFSEYERGVIDAFSV